MLATTKFTLWPRKFEKCFDNLSLEASTLEVYVYQGSPLTFYQV